MGTKNEACSKVSDLNGQVEVQAKSVADLTEQVNTLASEKMHLEKTAQEIESGLEAKVTLLETEVQEKAKAFAELRSEVEESKQKYTTEKACSDEKSNKLADLDSKAGLLFVHTSCHLQLLIIFGKF